MSKYEIDAPAIPEAVLVDIIGPRLEKVLDRRNNYVDRVTNTRLDISKSARLSVDLLDSADAASKLRDEQRDHLKHVDEQGIDIGFLQEMAIRGNTLTELRLEHYVAKMMGRLVLSANSESHGYHVFERWINTWTAEETNHGNTLRDVGTLLRLFDRTAIQGSPGDGQRDGIDRGEFSRREFELATLQMKTTPLGVNVGSLAELWSYLMMQEDATVISHKNTGAAFGLTLRAAMEDISENESTHCLMNTKLMNWALEYDPNHVIQALGRQVRTFSMPGAEGIPEFGSYMAAMEFAGIYDFTDFRKLVKEKISQLKIADRPLTGKTAKARDKLLDFVEDKAKPHKKEVWLEERREKAIAEAAKHGRVPFILGRTVLAPRNKPLQRVA